MEESLYFRAFLLLTKSLSCGIMHLTEVEEIDLRQIPERDNMSSKSSKTVAMFPDPTWIMVGFVIVCGLLLAAHSLDLF
ncbi:MAG: hypothetical protein HOJ15_02815 [Candidatus Jacksonbacteria bacterium]|nr:hypothetical protein [Candidatus Jacksonbacteria bacterium]MBT6034257.1 hypothetical protein [Candidatus Jacksonbacteria bacterium]MBT6301333.1 hypothetical protein [Candidatus Jacksonbacteria bacterium]MBT6756975.1 hypothetical protein [Candidatus Jacksonbacteria bacterium]MBT7008628.1 hypothetical protein [Candidatus Jacksonbacteria bacterium]